MRVVRRLSRPSTSRWIIAGAAVAYGILRVVLADAFLATYGVNVAVFAVVEVTSSAVFGGASGVLVDRVAGATSGGYLTPASVAIAGYLAPDVYVLSFADKYPSSLLGVILGIVVVSSIVTVVALLRRLQVLAPSEQSVDAEGKAR